MSSAQDNTLEFLCAGAFDGYEGVCSTRDMLSVRTRPAILMCSKSVREGSVNGEAQWDEWNALIEAHGVFDSKGRCKPAPISVLSPVAADCWGSFFIVWDLLKEARKFVAPEAGVAPFHECIILHGPGTYLLLLLGIAMRAAFSACAGNDARASCAHYG